MKVGLGLALILLASAATSAVADHEIQREGSGWVLLRISSTEEMGVSALINYSGPGTRFMHAYLPDGTFAGGLVGYQSGEGLRTSVEAGGVVLQEEWMDDVPDAFPWLGAVFASRMTLVGPPGEFLLLAAALGDVVKWEYWPVGAATQVTLLASGDGNAYLASDLASDANIHVRSFRSAAEASIGASITFDIEHTLVGAFDSDFDVRGGQSTLASPARTDICECFPVRPTGNAALGPGTYTFSATQVVARTRDIPIAAWVDVPILDFVTP